MAQLYHSNAITNKHIRSRLRQIHIRKRIGKSRISNSELSKIYGVSVTTIIKWKKRKYSKDASSRPNHINYSLTDKEKCFIKRIRKKTWLPVDAIWKMLQQDNPSVSRSSVYRTLVSFGLNKIPEDKKQKTKLIRQE